MPVIPKMSWEGAPAFRWVKMVDGKRFRLTCKELSLPRHQWTKEASLPLAQKFWAKKEERLFNTHAKPIDYMIANAKEAAAPQEELAALAVAKTTGADPVAERIEHSIDLLRSMGWTIEPPDGTDWIHWLEVREIFGGTVVEQERRRILGRNRRNVKGYSLAEQVEAFLLQAKANSMKPGTFRDLSKSLRNLIQTGNLSANLDSRTIDETTCQQFYLFVSAHPYAPGEKVKRFGFFRRFVNYLYETGILERLPRNLAKLKFRNQTKEVRYQLDHKQVLEVLQSLPKRLKAYFLLAANCGFQSQDISDLRKTECDLEKGTITRARSKTKHKGAPTVCYKLWPATIASLRECWSNHETLVLVSKAGTPLVVKNEQWEKNLIAYQWKNKVKAFPLVALRSHSATLLGKSFGREEIMLFLGHSAKEVWDKNYRLLMEDRLDKALTWLGEKYGA